jgi:hypothetical protein
MPASFDGQVGAIVLAMLGSTPKQPCSSGLGSSVSLSGARARLFGAIRAPSTLGSHLVRVNVLAVTVNTPLAAPVIAGTRMRGGNAASAPGATNFAARAVRAARACGCGCAGTIMVRMDSAYYAAGVLHAVRFRAQPAGAADALAASATIGRDLIAVPPAPPRHGRSHITLHLPDGWHRAPEWMNLFAAACGPSSSGLTAQTGSAPATPATASRNPVPAREPGQASGTVRGGEPRPRPARQHEKSPAPAPA